MAANVLTAAAVIVMVASGARPALAQDDCETTAGARRCLAARLDSAESELRAVLAQARGRAGHPALLDSAQAAWRLYVDRDCRAAAAIYSGGSLAPVVAQGCRLDHVRMRLRFLRQDYLSDEPAPGRRTGDST